MDRRDHPVILCSDCLYPSIGGWPILALFARARAEFVEGGAAMLRVLSDLVVDIRSNPRGARISDPRPSQKTRRTGTPVLVMPATSKARATRPRPSRALRRAGNALPTVSGFGRRAQSLARTDIIGSIVPALAQNARTRRPQL